VVTIPAAFSEEHASLEAEIGEPLSISGIVGSWGLFQRVRGHRHSIDDAMTAWYALQKRPHARRALDLGAGVGTVGLAVIHGLADDASLTCIEVQDASFRLLVANLACNGLQHRVCAIQGDLRDVDFKEKFDLVTATPPYFPPHAGTLPRDAQKAYARFELRGHVGDYARSAARHLREDGLFVYCFPFPQKQRGIDLVSQTGFHVASCMDVVPTPEAKPLFSVFAASMQGCGAMVEEAPLVVEGDDGRYSAEMLAVQASRGFGPQGTNVVDEGAEGAETA